MEREGRQMRGVYNIYRELADGQQLWVASYDDLKQAKQLKESLNRHWPGDYLIQESVSKDDEHKLMRNFVFDNDPV
jgi:hypothetical protein